MTTLTDASVAEYIGCTENQVRLMRMHTLTCPGCAKVHESYPQIKVFHSPQCETQMKCRICGQELPGLGLGHEVGLICATCYGKDSEGE